MLSLIADRKEEGIGGQPSKLIKQQQQEIIQFVHLRVTGRLRQTV